MDGIGKIAGNNQYSVDFIKAVYRRDQNGTSRFSPQDENKDVIIKNAHGDSYIPSNKNQLNKELDQAQLEQLRKLQRRDQEVRAHEQAHIAAGGSLVRGGAKYQYEKGPDGKSYAVGGEVSIDTAPVNGDPKATIAKAQAIKRAALAPAQPSSQDRGVAAQASRMEINARRQVATQAKEERESTKENRGPQARDSSNGVINIKSPISASKDDPENARIKSTGEDKNIFNSRPISVGNGNITEQSADRQSPINGNITEQSADRQSPINGNALGQIQNQIENRNISENVEQQSVDSQSGGFSYSTLSAIRAYQSAYQLLSQDSW